MKKATLRARGGMTNDEAPLSDAESGDAAAEPEWEDAAEEAWEAEPAVNADRGGDIRARLGLENPFDTFRGAPGLVDLQGWNSQHPFFDAAISTARPRLIIELGVWKGMSSLHMAGLAKAKGLDCQILAIDTWLGSSNHLSTPGRRQELRPVDGFPTVYRSFLANVVDQGHQDVIVPLAMDGTSAAFALRRVGVKAQVIHIDASHEFDACLADLQNYWSLLADDGILIADDYGTWPGVTRAVCRFASDVDRPVFGSMGKALIPKSPTLGFVTRVQRARSYTRNRIKSE